MSDPKSIGQILAEMVSDPNNPTGKLLAQCPCIQAIMENINQETAALKTDLSDWLDNQDVMQALHISCRTLQTLRSNGILPYSRINNKIYYRRHDIEQILNDNYKMAQIRWHHGK